MPQGRMRSVDASRFTMVPRNDVPRSAFDITHTHKTTLQAGSLIPLFVDEVLPGDSVRLNMLIYGRQSTSIVPTMDNLHLESFFFFVPNRLVWTNWERFMGEQLSPADTTEFLTPLVGPITQAQTFIDATSGQSSIYNYMGITLNTAGTISVQAMPFRGYMLIWNEFFRDADLSGPVTIPLGDGPDAATVYAILPRAKRHDYFTSARPWPQKPINATLSSYLDGGNRPGGPMTMRGPNQGAAPVTGLGRASGATTALGGTVREPGDRIQTYDDYYTGTQILFNAGEVNHEPDVKVLVNDMRTAIMIQGFLEKNARGGTRYAELVRSHFGVISPDARLQRPEYLGGGRTLLNMAPITQTAPGVAASTNLGDSAGKGEAIVYNHGFSSSFTEHGWIIGMVAIRADLTYQQGIERMWFRRTQFDFYWPSLAHLGEQAILQKEIYAEGIPGVDNDDRVFGYQERWSEYKYKPSRTSASMRSTEAAPLDVWHYAEEFGSAPFLNHTFIVDRTAEILDRTMLQEGAYSQQFIVDSMFEVRKVRPMPMFSIPGLGPRL